MLHWCVMAAGVSDETAVAMRACGAFRAGRKSSWPVERLMVAEALIDAKLPTR